MKSIFTLVNAILLTSGLHYCPSAIAQRNLPVLEKISVAARPYADSITLRWAPVNYATWRAGNISGYTIERYVMARDEKLLKEPEKAVLQSSVKPWQESAWVDLVQNNQYAAIAAQALYGDRFEVDLQQSDVFTIVNKVKENEQRFHFSLFSADMSRDVATASGLLFTDTHVDEGEKYLYRVLINGSDSLRGSAFVSPDGNYQLPKPQNLRGEFSAEVVFLKWDRVQTTPYTAFVVERSVDGIHYTRPSDVPLVTVSPNETTNNRYEYAIDSIADLSKTYYYRIRGITPFGEESPPSDAVSGRAIPSVEQEPFIIAAENIDNTSILVQWEFPETSNFAISGFSIERASSPGDTFTSLNKELIKPHLRSFEDESPHLVNYYCLKAHGLNGKVYPSHAFFAQLIDSIPPAVPSGLMAEADEHGNVFIAWTANSDRDIYGYRIYKAYHASEEPAQLTDAPVSDDSFTDRIELQTLNEYVYYQVMAVDINQNHSALSEKLKVKLPDRVKPQAPVLLPAKTDSAGILVSWIAGGSEDITLYKIYRKVMGEAGWREIKVIPASSDSLYLFKDYGTSRGEVHYYTVISVDDAGLESEPAHPTTTMNLPGGFPEGVNWKKPKINREENQVTLVWDHPERMVRSFKIFRTKDHSSPILLSTVEGDKTAYTDSMVPEHVYTYRIMAVFEDGQKSSVSEELKIEY